MDSQGNDEAEMYKAASDDDVAEEEDEGNDEINSQKRPLPADFVYIPPPRDDLSNPYGRSHFGDFSQYMRRKRAKLQIQNEKLASQNLQSDIFKGISIYINGWTQPSLQELRTLIVQNGGIYQPYLDKKSLVTHVVATNLTPAKVTEYKNLKVTLPEWIVQSISEGKLLPWQQFRYQPPWEKPPPSLLQLGFGTKAIADPHRETESSGSTVPRYTPHASNVHAQRAMGQQGWREKNTAASSTFIEGYYKNSRLHHLATWKTELKDLVRDAQDRVDIENSKSNEQDLDTRKYHGTSMRGADLPSHANANSSHTNKRRIIMHCDFDSFFVSVGLKSRPELRGKPVAVCHSQGGQGGSSSTSEVASCSYQARERGVRNGMSLYQARLLCSNLITLPYEFERYKEISLEFYTVLMKHADELQAVSVDEALVDVSSIVQKTPPQGEDTDLARQFAEQLRSELKATTGCEVSIGIGENILLARLATRRAKPAGSYHLLPADMEEFIQTLDVTDLHGMGRSIKQKCQERLGSSQLTEVRKKSRGLLSDALGPKTGTFIFNAVRGIDDRQLESHKVRQSVSAEINYGIRFLNDEEAKNFVKSLALEVARRLEDVDMKGSRITLKVMKRHPDAPLEAPKFMGHGKCNTFYRSGPLIGKDGRPTNGGEDISESVWNLLKTLDCDPTELRGVGVTIRPENTQDTAQSTLPFIRQSPKKIIHSHAPPEEVGRVELEENEVDERGYDCTTDNELEEGQESLFPVRDASRKKSAASLVKALAPKQRSGLSPRKGPLFAQREQALPTSDSEYSVGPVSQQEIFEDEEEQDESENGSDKEAESESDPIYIERVPLVLEDVVEPPIATMRRLPALKDPSGQRLEDSEEIQHLVTAWIEGHKLSPPKQDDIQVFKNFLVQCVDDSRSNDPAIETATEVMGWWKFILAREWPVPQEGDTVGNAWWMAFKDIHESMNEHIRSRFGGVLRV